MAEKCDRAILTDQFGQLIVDDLDYISDILNNPFDEFRRLDNENRTDGLLDINAANQEQLMTVPGIGKKLAERILSERNSRPKGRIDNVDELSFVPEKIRKKLDTEGQPAFDLNTEFNLRTLGHKRLDDFFFGKFNPSPVVRMMQNSKSEMTRRLAARLFEASGLSFSTDGVLRQSIPVETMIKRWDRNLVRALAIKESAYQKYANRMTGKLAVDIRAKPNTRRQIDQTVANFKALAESRLKILENDFTGLHGILTPAEFDRRLAIAMFSGDVDDIEAVARIPGMNQTAPIPEISEAAKAVRKELFDPMMKEAIAQRLFTAADVEILTAGSKSFFHRVYDRERIAADPRAFENAVAEFWATRRHMDPDEARIAASQLRSHLMEKGVGRLATFDNVEDWLQLSGPARKRIVDVPDEVILPWLDLNFDSTVRAYVKTLSPDIEIQRFLRAAQKEHAKVKLRKHNQKMSERPVGDPIKQESLRGQIEEMDKMPLGEERSLAQADIARKIERDLNLLADMSNAEIHKIIDLLFTGRRGKKQKALIERMLSVNKRRPMSLRQAQRKASKDFRDLEEHWSELARIREQDDIDTVELEEAFQRFRKARERAGLPWRMDQHETWTMLDNELEQWMTNPRRGPGLDIEPLHDWIRGDYDDLRLRLQEELDAGRITKFQFSEENKALAKRADADWQTFRDLIEMLRNRHISPDLTHVPSTRFMRGFRRLNVLTMGGGFMLSSLPDMGRLAMIDGLMPLFHDAKLLKRGDLKLLREELSDLLISNEQVLNQRASLMTEVSHHLNPTKMEKLLELGADQMFMLNLMSPWNDYMKLTAAHMLHRKIARVARQVSEGADTPEDFFRLGLDGPLLKRIHQQMKKYQYDSVEGIPVSKMSNWDDIGAKTAYEDVLKKEVDNIIVTPGVGDRPILMSQEVFKTFLQYKSFAMAATNRVLLAGAQNLSHGDKLVLQQLGAMVALGMMVEVLKSYQYGYRLPDSIPGWVAAGVDRAGMFGIYTEVDSVLQAATGGTVSARRLIGAGPAHPYVRQRLPGILLGPTFSRIPQFADLMNAMASGDLRPRDVQHIRNLVALQNIFWLDPLFDAIFDPWKKAVRNTPTRN